MVTGGAGFIGCNFVRYWRKTHAADRIVVFDLLTYAGHLPSIEGMLREPEVSFVKGDIRDEAEVYRVMREYQIDTVVHFAAESSVDRSIRDPGTFVDTNVSGTHCLLMAARRAWLLDKRVPVHRFHQVSTDEVYGSLSAEDPPASETRPYAPNSPYAASKVGADYLVRAYHQTYGLATTTTNCSNNYGPYQMPEKLIPKFILNCLHGVPLPIYGDGLNVRDWMHVEDHCRAIDSVLERGNPGEIYNVSGESALANCAIVDCICDLVDQAFRSDSTLSARFPRCPAARGASVRCLKTFVEDRPGHDRRYEIDISKLKRQLGFALSTDLHSGLTRTVNWYLENEVWWRGVLCRPEWGFPSAV
jgi:dTDP-glucose 4,6-dehydratase